MADPQLTPAAKALQNGDIPQARRLLKPILKESPSADAWYLAARTMDDDEKTIACLKKALALNEWHTEANRLLHRLEGVKPQETFRPVERSTTQTNPLLDTQRKPKEMSYQKREVDRRRRRRFMFLMIEILMMSISTVTMGAVGMFPGAIGFFTQLFGGPKPITQVDGVRIEDLPNAAAIVPVSQSQEATGRDVDLLDHGYNHEYTFTANRGETVLGYVQIMSPFAEHVQDNVAILTPSGSIAPTDVCWFLGEKGLLGGQGNTSFECRINATGTWRLHILGIKGETTGAYFVGVETLDKRDEYGLFQ
jgi:hypothetical protein